MSQQPSANTGRQSPRFAHFHPSNFAAGSKESYIDGLLNGVHGSDWRVHVIAVDAVEIFG